MRPRESADFAVAGPLVLPIAQLSLGYSFVSLRSSSASMVSILATLFFPGNAAIRILEHETTCRLAMVTAPMRRLPILLLMSNG
jgi:hypothetical protein